MPICGFFDSGAEKRASTDAQVKGLLHGRGLPVRRRMARDFDGLEGRRTSRETTNVVRRTYLS